MQWVRARFRLMDRRQRLLRPLVPSQYLSRISLNLEGLRQYQGSENSQHLPPTRYQLFGQCWYRESEPLSLRCKQDTTEDRQRDLTFLWERRKRESATGAFDVGRFCQR
jgi:hypothetical protein